MNINGLRQHKRVDAAHYSYDEIDEILNRFISKDQTEIEEELEV